MGDYHLYRFENKSMPVEPPSTKIVEAFGLGKCPKLVSQVLDSNLQVRVGALKVLCDEFQNPYSIERCVAEGIIPIISSMISDPDYTTRVRSSCALKLAVLDSIGLASVLQNYEEVLPLIVKGIYDPSENVRKNIYEAINSITRTLEGAEIVVKFDVVRIYFQVLPQELPQLKEYILRALYNLVGNEQGIVDCLEVNGVKILVDHLNFSTYQGPQKYLPVILSEATRTLGFLCFDGRAKSEALEQNAINYLVLILKEKFDELSLKVNLKLNVTIALMAITITNTGKIQFFQEPEGLDAVMLLLYDDNRTVVINSLKIISNLSVYPQCREVFVNDSTCVVKIRKLSKSEDHLMAKHASIALQAVNWNP